MDGRTLVFTPLRPGGYGPGDLYVSEHRAATSLPPRNLGPAATVVHDAFHSTLSRDCRGLLSVQRRPTRQRHGDSHRIATGSFLDAR